MSFAPARAGDRQANAAPSTAGFDIRKFGAAGNGVADDTAAFRAMHRAMRRAQAADDAARAGDPSRPALEFLVTLPPGHYRYTWNRWTWGLRRITISGYGATIQCTHGGPYDIDQAPLISNREHFWTWSESAPAYGGSPPAKEDFGYLIRTARPGDMAIQLGSAHDGASLARGAWILIQSYAQQMDGYPPNLRYFERARIISITGNTIQLDRPLIHLHKDNWPEDSSQPACIGRARIVSIDRPDCPLALRQTFLGLTVRSNPNHAVRDAAVRTTRETLAICGTLEALVKDCSLIALGVTQAGRVHVDNCSLAYTEPDKIVDELVFSDCKIGSIEECTGVNRVTLRHCAISAPARIFSREAVIEGCTVEGAREAGEFASGFVVDGPTPTRHLSITGSHFLGRNDPTGLALGGRIWSSFLIDGQAIKTSGGDNLEIDAGTAQFGNLLGRLEEGWPVKVQGIAGDRFGTCIEIVGRRGAMVVRLSLTGPLSAGDTLLIPSVAAIDLTHCQFTDLRQDFPDPPLLTWQDEVHESRLLRLELQSDFASRGAWLPGNPRRIRCLVEKTYSGPDEGCFLVLRDGNPKIRAFDLAIDLRVEGEREISTAGALLKAGDLLETAAGFGGRLPHNVFVAGADTQIVPRPGAVPAPARGTALQQARLILEIAVDRPFA
jgi:hypothetical protein